MKLTFKLPLPDHHPKEAFEYMTGYGFVTNIDPVNGTFEYELEDETLGKLVQRVDEVQHELQCYDWWSSNLDMFEQAQAQIDAQKIGVLEVTQGDVKSLEKLLRRIAMKPVRAHVVISLEDVAVASSLIPKIKGFKVAEAEDGRVLS